MSIIKYLSIKPNLKYFKTLLKMKIKLIKYFVSQLKYLINNYKLSNKFKTLF